jgi:hypothetical protein
MINIKLVIILLLISFKAIAQITLIPDSSFEHYLVNQGIDTDGLVNGQVLTSDISDETELHLFFLQAEDLTGIEDFASLEVLFLEVMDITSLDISQNSNLKRLSIDGLNLVSLDISQNLDLFYIFLSFGTDPSLNQITHLDVSNNLLLEHLGIYRGSITSVDISNNTLIDYVELNNIDDLETVNLKSGSNEMIDFLRIRGNAALQCVQVDDPVAVIAGIDPPYDDWIIENAPLISDDCQLDLEENLLDLFTVYPNPVKETLHIKSNGVEITKLSLYDMLGRLVLEKSTEFENIDVSALESGWFILKLETEFGVQTKKLLME